MTESRRTLSAYAPMCASAPEQIEFTVPLQVYIIETIEREARNKLLRQLSLVAMLVVGIFVGQWPVAFSSANAVQTLPVSAQTAGARGEISPATMERLAFAVKLQGGIQRPY